MSRDENPFRRSITQGLKRATQVAGGKFATLHGTRTRTWHDFSARVAKMAGGLQQLGVGIGDRVAVLALNSDRYLEAYYAIPWAGAVIVPLNTRLAAPELEFMLDDSGTICLIVDDQFHELALNLKPKLKSLAHVILASNEGTESSAESINYEELSAQATPIDDVRMGGSDLAGIFYTGGTTGRSKGVMLSHDNLVSHAVITARGLGYDDHTCYLHAGPMFHLADGASTFAVTMAGGTHAFIPKFDPEAVLRAFQDYAITHGQMVPTMINMVTHVATVGQYDLSRLVRLGYGGSPISESVLSRAKGIFKNVEFTQAYGMTELSPIITFLEDEWHQFDGPDAQRARSAGRATIDSEVKIVNETGDEVARETIGEIVARGPTVMQGYWNLPEQTREALRDGWMHTGDVGYMDKEGFIFVVDRLKDMIISGGENIYSVEVENVIFSHPAIAACAVIGLPDDTWGERVHAIVNLKPGSTVSEEELIAFLQGKIAGYKIPRNIEIQEEPLPLSGAGKVLKSELRRQRSDNAADS